MSLATDVARLTAEQRGIAGEASSTLRDLFSSLDLSRPDRARDALLEAYPAVVDIYGGASATASAEWYEATRRATVGGRYAATVAPEIPLERLQGTVRWAAGGLFGEFPGSTLDLLDGSLFRSLEDLGRDTIVENTKADSWAYGFHRIARADGCDFCVMLSQRGAVYRRDTADFASHDNCGCKAAPSWDPSAPEVDVRAYEMSRRMSDEIAEMNDPNTRPSRRAAIQGAMDMRRARTNAWLHHNKDELDAYRAELS